jgi:transcriptional regulator with XRE-family HTH domain
MATFKERINQLFEEAKDNDHELTQVDFAARYGATRNKLTGWLDGRGEPPSETLKHIAKVSGVSVAWLVGETDIRNPYSDDDYKAATSDLLPLVMAQYDTMDLSPEEQAALAKLKDMPDEEKQKRLLKYIKTATVREGKVEYELIDNKELLAMANKLQSLPSETREAIKVIIDSILGSSRR